MNDGATDSVWLSPLEVSLCWRVMSETYARGRPLLFSWLKWTALSILVHLAPISTTLSQESRGIPQASDLLTEADSVSICVSSSLDKTRSNKKLLSEYVNSDLEQLVEDQLQLILERTHLNITPTRHPIRIVSCSDSLSHHPRHVTYALHATIFVDGESSLWIGVEISQVMTNALLYGVPFQRVAQSDILSKLEGPERNPDSDIHRLQVTADELCDRIEPYIVRWFVQFGIRFRVGVAPFENLSENNTRSNLGAALKTMVETELSRSDAILVYTTLSSDTSMSEATKYLNYTIDGKYIEHDGQLRIDIRCIKEPFNRILSSRKAVAKKTTMDEISTIVFELTHQIKRTMESDFNTSVRSLAVVAKHSDGAYSSKSSQNVASRTAQEIAGAVAQKFRLLIRSDAKTQSIGRSGRRLEVLATDRYVSGYARASEILGDLDADYVGLLSYQDLGSDVRVGLDLHSFESERPTAATYIHHKTVDKSDVNHVVNEIVVRLGEEMCQRGYLSPVGCQSIGDLNEERIRTLNRVRVSSILLRKRIGFRWGAVASRSDPEMYLGRKSGNYIEAFISVMPRWLEIGREGGTFDLGFEGVMGLDFGGTGYSIYGPASLSLFLNGKLVMGPWKNSGSVLNLSVGGGPGMQNLRYLFSPGDRDFIGDETYLETDFVFAVNLFTELEYSFGGRFGLDALFRYVPPLFDVTGLDSPPLVDRDPDDRPVGPIGASYLVGGIWYRFR